MSVIEDEWFLPCGFLFICLFAVPGMKPVASYMITLLHPRTDSLCLLIAYSLPLPAPPFLDSLPSHPSKAEILQVVLSDILLPDTPEGLNTPSVA